MGAPLAAQRWRVHLPCWGQGLDPQARKIPRAWEQLSPGVSRRSLRAAQPVFATGEATPRNTCALQGKPVQP